MNKEQGEGPCITDTRHTLHKVYCGEPGDMVVYGDSEEGKTVRIIRLVSPAFL